MTPLQQAAAKFALNAINKFISSEHLASAEIVDLHIAAGKLSDALEAEQAQAVEPVASLTVSHFRRHLTNHDVDYFGDLPAGEYSLYTHPAPPAAGDHIENNLNMVGERAELIARLNKYAAGDGFQRVIEQAIDMLEADAKEIAGWQADQKENLRNQVALQEQINSLKAQQVAAPVEMTGDQIIEWMRQRGLGQLDAENQALCVRLIRAYEENPKIGVKP